ncbi:MAG: extracellular solute-binding protein [Treponema sp.]|jgi:putative aldouronate transport system substrate-binding protein|nr:extracellular solute-binding protein [Treponema sp.]
MNKKIVLFGLALLLAASMAFAGGGGDKAPAASGAPVKITVEIFDRGTDGGKSLAHDNAWTKWIHDKVLKDLNIDVTFMPVGRWSENTDIINLMASGSAPDLCYTYNQDMIASFRDQGGILDLAPYIDRYLPDLKKLLGADPAITGKDFIYRNAIPGTGKIYSIPSYRVALAQRNIFIRKDWLDKLGLPLPRTTQEFHDALVAFRDRDPGNVGRTRVVPLANADVQWELGNFILPSVDPKLSDRERWVYSIAERYLMMPGYKEGVRMVNQWYNEGLIFRDFPLLKGDDLNNMIKSGVVGAISQNWDLPYRTDYKILEDLRKNVPGADFVPVDCIQSSDGITHKNMMDKVGLQMFVPAFSKNKEAALQYLNWLAKPENYQFLQVGTVGVNHQIVNGVPNTIGRPAGDLWFMNSTNNIDYTMPMNGVEMGTPELNSRVLALGYGDTPPEVIVNAYTISTRNARAAAVFQSPPLTQGGVYGQTTQAKADALLSQLVTCRPADFDRLWDSGYREWLASGAQEMYDERSAAYPR